jgi:hypothetical protein
MNVEQLVEIELYSQYNGVCNYYEQYYNNLKPIDNLVIVHNSLSPFIILSGLHYLTRITDVLRHELCLKAAVLLILCSLC